MINPTIQFIRGKSVHININTPIKTKYLHILDFSLKLYKQIRYLDVENVYNMFGLTS